jgi:hypothetical protein
VPQHLSRYPPTDLVVCRYFAGYGVRDDSTRIAASLWRRFLPAEL